ncbi:MAG: acyltransferase [Alphaproteobacteria bacterium]|nr:acyltransferase [Alphaproteobacteria bacterium]
MENHKNMLEDIERLRGFACLIVLIHHIAWICPIKYIYNIVPFRLLLGEGGVFIFFAISGFVVTLSLRDKISALLGDVFLERFNNAKSLLYSFFKRRFFRIVPVMLFTVALTGVYLFISETNLDWLRAWTRSVPELIFGVFHSSEELYQSVDKIHNNGMGPLWTLAMEAQFYMLWPLILLLCKDNNARAITSLLSGCLFLFVIQPVIAAFVGVKYYATYAHLPCLLLGSFFAFIYTEDIGKNFNKYVAQIITALLALTVWYYPNTIERTYFCRIPLHLASVFLVMLCAFVKDSFNFPIIGRFFKFLGTRSYSFYAIQTAVACFIIFYTNSIYFPKESFSEYEFYVYQFIIFIVVLFTLTEFVYRFIEKPLREFGRHSK